MGLFKDLKSKLAEGNNNSTNFYNNAPSQVQSFFQSSPQAQVQYPSVPEIPLGPESVVRYRKQRGVNLGSWFSQEAWINGEPFKNAVPPKSSDLDIAKSPTGKQALEHLWDNWITEDDWRWIVERGFNTVRLPIGYYHLSHPSACPPCLENTDFAPHADVYEGAWPRIQRAIEEAGRWGLGVLVDLHGCAGGQNDDAHSGTSTGQTNFWSSPSNLQSTSLALKFLAHYLAPIQHVVGLQLMNEPKNDGRLGGWYDSMRGELRGVVGPSFPLYIHDAWDTAWYSQYPGKNPNEFLVTDHHLYRCFTSDDHVLTGEQHAGVLRDQFRHSLAEYSRNSNKALIIGEFSAALHQTSHPNKGNCPDSEKDRQRRVFLQAQLELYEEFCSGWYFWTLKKGREEGWDCGWSARDAGTAEVLPGWVGGKVRREGMGAGDGDRENALGAAYHTHVNYWSQRPGQYEHDRFHTGLNQGWDDALLFIFHNFGGEKAPQQRATSVIAFEGNWVRRRVGEHLARRGDGPGVWEFENGWRQGVDLAQRAFLA